MRRLVNPDRKGYALALALRSPWNQWLVKIGRPVYRAAARVGLGMVAYRGLVAFVRFSAGLPLIGAERDRLAEPAWRFLRETALVPPRGYRRALRRIVVVDRLAALCGRGLEVLAPHDVERVVRVIGRDHLEAARAAGRPIVCLHLHLRFTRLFWTCLRRWGIGEGYLVVPPVHPDASPQEKRVERAAGMVEALKTLRAGGMVHVLADAHTAAQFTTVPFVGRARPFPIGFAALALATDAVILPVSSIARSDGQACVTIGAPFDRAGVTSLANCRPWVEAYARFAEDVWRRHVDNLVLDALFLEKHLTLPRLPEGTSVAPSSVST